MSIHGCIVDGPLLAGPCISRRHRISNSILTVKLIELYLFVAIAQVLPLLGDQLGRVPKRNVLIVSSGAAFHGEL
jgi:hypothetical protein